jgi:HD superfamily phosphohydrolase YqeK
MISKDEAFQLIQTSSRYEHAIVVATFMYHLAVLLGEDPLMWELVGLLHDLDYDNVQHDMTSHGLVASETLKDKLPAEARYAIRCHDHRTGIKPHNTLDKALIIADTLANVMNDMSDRLTQDRVVAIIEHHAINKPWLSRNIQLSHEIGIPQQMLVKLIVDVRNKMKHWVRVCPRCFSPRIAPYTQGFWIWSTQRFQCQDCLYHGNNFVELRLNELERITGPETREPSE